MSRRHSRPPGPRAVPAPRGGKRGAEGAGEAIMDGMRVGDVAGADFDAIERMLAAPADDAAVRLSRLRERERQEERVRALQAALLEAPGDGARLQALANALRVLDRRAELLDVYRRMQRLAPEREEIGHMIAALSGEAGTPERAADGYVRSLFDATADSFDETLSNWLDYRAPDLVAEAVRAALGPGATTLATIDLGCGTGLAGPLLRGLTRRLEGVDLSPRMLEKARARGYDALFEDEIGRFLSTRRGQYTLAVACDVFCYFGELAGAFRAVHDALKPGGVFAFTVERIAGEGHALGASGRYAHSHAFVVSAAAAAGFAPVSEAEVRLRTELHRPVVGGCYVFRRA